MSHVHTSCPLCGGQKEKGTTTYSVDNGQSLIVVRSVPAMICQQCGEEWIDHETAQALERIVDEGRQKNAQVEIVAL